MTISFQQHYERQIAFSRATFGPGQRTQGVIDHIRKELTEVEKANAVSGDRAKEWVDVVILAMDGLWRELAYCHGRNIRTETTAEWAVGQIREKLSTNELRNWPDWRTADPTKAIEHDRSGEKAGS